MTDDTISKVPADAVPALSPAFRLQYEKAQQSWVLLYPEGMVKLNESAAEILQRCDGIKTVTDITTQLEETFEETGLISEVIDFVTLAKQQRWLTF